MISLTLNLQLPLVKKKNLQLPYVVIDTQLQISGFFYCELYSTRKLC